MKIKKGNQIFCYFIYFKNLPVNVVNALGLTFARFLKKIERKTTKINEWKVEKNMKTYICN